MCSPVVAASQRYFRVRVVSLAAGVAADEVLNSEQKVLAYFLD